MKNFVKILCVVMALTIALSCVGCSLTKQSSYKTADTELPIGVYIYALYSAYNQAQGFAQKSDLYDSETKKYDGNDSFLGIEITDDDGNKATADQWIVDKTDETMRLILAVDSEFQRLGCTVDEAQYKTQAKEYWDHGPYYQYYGEQYDQPYSDIFEPLGVSYDSFYIATFLNGAKEEAVFDALYGATGSQAVKDDELTDFFTKNYTSYKYFSANLYKSEEQATKDDAGNDTTENVDVPLSDDEVKEYMTTFKTYAEMINAGASYEDVVAAYQSAYSVEDDPTASGVEIMEDSTIGDDLVNEISTMKDGRARWKVIGDDDSSKMIYLFYREPIKNQIKSYIKDETNRKTVLQKMKEDDFKQYLLSVAEKLSITKSSACNQYTPKFIEKNTASNDSSSAAA